MKEDKSGVIFRWPDQMLRKFKKTKWKTIEIYKKDYWSNGHRLIVYNNGQ